MEKLVCVAEAAEALRLSPSTIRFWIFSRRISSVKIGRRVFLRLCDIEDLIRNGLRPAGEREAKDTNV